MSLSNKNTLDATAGKPRHWRLKPSLTKQLKRLFDVQSAKKKTHTHIKYKQRPKECAMVSVYLLMSNCF